MEKQKQQRRLNWRLVALLSVIVTSAALGIGLWQRVWSPAGLSTVELAPLEDFMMSGWDDVVQTNEATTDWDVLNAQPPLQRQ